MGHNKEASARIKINKLLERAGWRFFDDDHGTANIQLEPGVKLTPKDIDNYGDDFERVKTGRIDFLLLDEDGFPFVVLEAKREEKDPLDGKEQARKYAQSAGARFVLLSNGNMHYFWDMERGNPEVITEFPTQESLMHRRGFKPDNRHLADEKVDADYIALTQSPNYRADPRYQNEATREQFIADEGLRMLRPYQLKAIHALQKSAASGNDRFLFEMATGTGKTLVSAAVIKLFLRSGNARRILFLVDRVELENQAWKNFSAYLSQDYHSVIYKHNRDDWKKAEIVVTTVQSLTAGDKYKRYFSPTDFHLVISDEAHRSINGNSRAVFEFFVGYKLGLTATPKDYLKNVDEETLSAEDPRAWERRQLLDTYKTFGCQTGEPTFRYSLIDGVKGGYLVNPFVVDARTNITTELLSKLGYTVIITNDEGEIEKKGVFHKRDFERKLFSENTNRALCKAFIENALRDPLSGEVGKTIVFCVSQRHAGKITQYLNEAAQQRWGDKYRSDFAVQITSNVDDAQRMSMNFANNNLNGRTQFLSGYPSSKTRVCVTVGMMTTGYDCQDILNLVLLRPVFSPTDFVQIKGRGTRKFVFKHKDSNGDEHRREKKQFKFFDFFANFDYFEEEFNYNERLELPVEGAEAAESRAGDYDPNTAPLPAGAVELFEPDHISKVNETAIGVEGMKVDRKLFEKAQAAIEQDGEIKDAVDKEQWDKAVAILRKKYENKPALYLTPEKLRRSENLDRRLSWREILERIFGIIGAFKSKDEKLENELSNFIAIFKPPSEFVPLIRNYLKAYIADEGFRQIINSGNFADINTYPGFSMQEFRALGEWRDIVPEFVKNYVPLNQYMD